MLAPSLPATVLGGPASVVVTNVAAGLCPGVSSGVVVTGLSSGVVVTRIDVSPCLWLDVGRNGVLDRTIVADQNGTTTHSGEFQPGRVRIGVSVLDVDGDGLTTLSSFEDLNGRLDGQAFTPQLDQNTGNRRIHGESLQLATAEIARSKVVVFSHQVAVTRSIGIFKASCGHAAVHGLLSFVIVSLQRAAFTGDVAVVRVRVGASSRRVLAALPPILRKQILASLTSVALDVLSILSKDKGIFRFALAVAFPNFIVGHEEATASVVVVATIATVSPDQVFRLVETTSIAHAIERIGSVESILLFHAVLSIGTVGMAIVPLKETTRRLVDKLIAAAVFGRRTIVEAIVVVHALARDIETDVVITPAELLVTVVIVKFAVHHGRFTVLVVTVGIVQLVLGVAPAETETTEIGTVVVVAERVALVAVRVIALAAGGIPAVASAVGAIPTVVEARVHVVAVVGIRRTLLHSTTAHVEPTISFQEKDRLDRLVSRLNKTVNAHGRGQKGTDKDLHDGAMN